MKLTELPTLRKTSRDGVTIEERVISKPGGQYGSIVALLTIERGGKVVCQETCWDWAEAEGRLCCVAGGHSGGLNQGSKAVKP